MRVLLKTELDCPPDAAWRAIRDPRVFRELMAPLLAVESLERGGFPDTWSAGPHRVAIRALGLVPIGEQVVDIGFFRKGDARVMRDSGGGVSGALAAAPHWDHRLAVSPAPGGRTLYRDRLTVESAALWPGFWAFWQWRLHRMRRAAPAWT